jgi:hypothetical protein
VDQPAAPTPWPPTGTREYGTAPSKQATIRLDERVLPPDVEYVINTLHRTVHHDRTLPSTQDLTCGR